MKATYRLPTFEAYRAAINEIEDLCRDVDYTEETLRHKIGGVVCRLRRPPSPPGSLQAPRSATGDPVREQAAPGGAGQ